MAAALALTQLVGSPALAQHGSGDGPAADSTMPRYGPQVLGQFTRPASTDSPTAQAYFNQGFQAMYAFAKDEATGSFRAAWANDPECAICFWGEAWAWGPYLNGPMSSGDAPRAWAAIQRAKELADGRTTDAERALIDAMQVRYAEPFDREGQPRRDSAYAESMRRVHEAYPDDLDIATLYAESLFLLMPRRGTRDLADPDVVRLHTVLESVLARDIRHVGACHLYIHATESTLAPGKAEPCAEFIGSAIPGASHINHMPSHTWNEVGRWGDAVRANLQAWHSDQKASVGEGFAIYPSHNLHMLLFAASMDGQGAIAMQAGRDYATLTGNTMYQVLTLVRFGRFTDILAVSDRPAASVPGGLWDFAQGYAHLRGGEPDFARVYLARVLATADTSSGTFRFHDAAHVLGVVGGILEGEILRAEGDSMGAIAAFERAVAIEDDMTYDEPEPLPFAARHWLGYALLDAGRFDEAAEVYRAELEDHPRNGWSLFGLVEALRAQGAPTAQPEAELAESWARSDTWIRGSRF